MSFVKTSYRHSYLPCLVQISPRNGWIFVVKGNNKQLTENVTLSSLGVHIKLTTYEKDPIQSDSGTTV